MVMNTLFLSFDGKEYDARIKNPVLGGGAYQERVALRGRKVDMGFHNPGRCDRDGDSAGRKDSERVFRRDIPH